MSMSEKNKQKLLTNAVYPLPKTLIVNSLGILKLSRYSVSTYFSYCILNTLSWDPFTIWSLTFIVDGLKFKSIFLDIIEFICAFEETTVECKY